MGQRRHEPLVIAHRGACGYRPEHTRPAYELAFALGADAVEPDLVATKDGVLVLRHESEISRTTDIAERQEFADRRTTKVIDGEERSGWFTEDFTWAELSTLRARERLGGLRPQSSSFDRRFPVLRFRELLEIMARADEEHGREFGLVAEFKHASHFAGLGLPLDELFQTELSDAGWGTGGDRLILESFELTVLDRLAERVQGKRILLIEVSGAPWDQVLEHGDAARPFSDYLTSAGLQEVAARFDGVSIPKSLIMNERRRTDASGSPLVDAAHAAGLDVLTWTLRPENRFLAPEFRGTGGDGVFGNWHGEFAHVFATGVDAVFADHPDLALAAAGRVGRPA